MLGIGAGVFERRIGHEVGALGEKLFDDGIGVIAFDVADVGELRGGEIGKNFFDGQPRGICIRGNGDGGGFSFGAADVESERERAVGDGAEDSLGGVEGGEDFLQVVIGRHVGGHGDLQGGEELIDFDGIGAADIAIAREFLRDGETHALGKFFFGRRGVKKRKNGDSGFGLRGRSGGEKQRGDQQAKCEA